MNQDAVVEQREAFRALARGYADSAAKWIDDDSDRSIIYAALELRFCLEALAYDLACDYLEELGDPTTLEWQPPKLIDRLVKIDPYADSTVYLAAVDPETGKRNTIAADNRMDLKKLKRRYQKLSSALHAPTIAKIRSGKPRNVDKLRADCKEILQVVEKVLDSGLMLSGLIHRHIFVMHCECGALVRRRTDPLQFNKYDPNKGIAALVVRCWKCSNTVQLSVNGDSYEVIPLLYTFDCPFEDCGRENLIRERDMVDGFRMDCAHCASTILMSAALRPVADHQKSSQGGS